MDTGVYRINPLEDPRWARFVEAHPRASAFHTPGWLEALRRTYRYEPVVMTTAEPGEELANGIVCCRVKSWLTGRRLVSLPFSDHCEPLVNSEQELEQLLSALQRAPDASRWGYIEIRPTFSLVPNGESRDAQAFYLHRLDLSPSAPELFHDLHRDCVQRKIRRAEREGLSHEEGRSESLLRQFYQLHEETRQRQGMPAQPVAWFRNLIECMGDKLTISVASKNGLPVASIVTLRHKQTVLYKYGCSDKRFSNLGGVQLLLWKTIEEAKRDGLADFDMGRCDLDNRGLRDFKRRWGTTETNLVYRRYRASSSQPSAAFFGLHLVRWFQPSTAFLGLHLVRQASTLAPTRLVLVVGRALYRHLG